VQAKIERIMYEKGEFGSCASLYPDVWNSVELKKKLDV